MEIYFLLFSHRGLGMLVGDGGWVADSKGGGWRFGQYKIWVGRKMVYEK